MSFKSSCVNKVILFGYVNNTPKKHLHANGTEYLHLQLCTPEKIAKNGQLNDHLEMHSLVIDPAHPDLQGKRLAKGTWLYVNGKIQTKMTVDAQNVKRYKTEISVLQLEFLVGAQQETDEPTWISRPTI